MAKGDHNKEVMLADIYALRGRYKEAAQLYQKAGQESKALAMYTDLRMFSLAQVNISSSNNLLLISGFVFIRITWTRAITIH